MGWDGRENALGIRSGSISNICKFLIEQTYQAKLSSLLLSLLSPIWRSIALSRTVLAASLCLVPLAPKYNRQMKITAKDQQKDG